MFVCKEESNGQVFVFWEGSVVLFLKYVDYPYVIVYSKNRVETSLQTLLYVWLLA